MIIFKIVKAIYTLKNITALIFTNFKQNCKSQYRYENGNNTKISRQSTVGFYGLIGMLIILILIVRTINKHSVLFYC